MVKSFSQVSLSVSMQIVFLTMTICNKMKPTLFLLFLFILNGCAVINTSMLETAEILEPGHLKAGVHFGTGLDLENIIIVNDTSNIFYDNDLMPIPVQGINLGIGVIDNMELNIKYWKKRNSVGMQFYLKYGILKDSNNFGIAVFPGVSYLANNTENNEYRSQNNAFQFISYGGFLPLVIHYELDESHYLYGSIRYSIDKLQSSNNESFLFNRLGFVSGLSTKFGLVYLRPEIGLEGVKFMNWDIMYIPNLNIGIGFEF